MKDKIDALKVLAKQVKEKRNNLKTDTNAIAKEVMNILEQNTLTPKEKNDILNEVYIDGVDDVMKYYLKQNIVEKEIMSTNIAITTPQDKLTDNIDHIISKFEEKFNEEEDDLDFYHLIITGEYPRRLLDMVEKEYTKAGWVNVVCNTSSESGERGGLTGLKLSRKI